MQTNHGSGRNGELIIPDCRAGRNCPPTRESMTSLVLQPQPKKPVFFRKAGLLKRRSKRSHVLTNEEESAMSDHDHGPKFHAHCCPHCDCESDGEGISRRSFLGGMSGAALGGMALAWMSWSEIAGADDQLPAPPARKPLVVKPILTYAVPQRAPQTSWRSWGGIQTEQDAKAETARIQDELNKLQAAADFPVQFLPRHGDPRSETAGGGSRPGRRRHGPAVRGGRTVGRLPAVPRPRQRRHLLRAAQVRPGVAVVRDRQPRPAAGPHRPARRRRTSTSRTWWWTARTKCSGGCEPCAA